jgi:hypothetical protein
MRHDTLTILEPAQAAPDIRADCGQFDEIQALQPREDLDEVGLQPCSVHVHGLWEQGLTTGHPKMLLGQFPLLY